MIQKFDRDGGMGGGLGLFGLADSSPACASAGG